MSSMYGDKACRRTTVINALTEKVLIDLDTFLSFFPVCEKGICCMASSLLAIHNIASMKTYYRRHLPHIQPPHATFFVTFRLAGSLPAHVIAMLKQKRKEFERKLSQKYGPKEIKERLAKSRKLYFGKFDSLLDRATEGNRWLANPKVADLVAESISYRDGKEYDLIAY